MEQQPLKNKVKAYWNQASCGTEFITQKKHSQEYFNAIETFRYTIEPEIHAFAQFTRFHGKKVLEVGIGAGTDFIQWVRAGSQAYGIDLTEEAIRNVENRLKLEGLQAKECKVADAEHLPYPDDFFDLVYSWGVIHHSPDTKQCLKELVRVVKPNGIVKVMIYNRRSLFAWYRWVLCALFKGNPFQSIKKILFFNQESPGTKAYTFKEAKDLFADLPVFVVKHNATVSNHDLLYYKNNFFRFCAYVLAAFLGWNKIGWFMTIELQKKP